MPRVPIVILCDPREEMDGHAILIKSQYNQVRRFVKNSFLRSNLFEQVIEKGGGTKAK